MDAKVVHNIEQICFSPYATAKAQSSECSVPDPWHRLNNDSTPSPDYIPEHNNYMYIPTGVVSLHVSKDSAMKSPWLQEINNRDEHRGNVSPFRDQDVAEATSSRNQCT